MFGRVKYFTNMFFFACKDMCSWMARITHRASTATYSEMLLLLWWLVVLAVFICVKKVTCVCVHVEYLCWHGVPKCFTARPKFYGDSAWKLLIFSLKLLHLNISIECWILLWNLAYREGQIYSRAIVFHCNQTKHWRDFWYFYIYTSE